MPTVMMMIIKMNDDVDDKDGLDDCGGGRSCRKDGLILNMMMLSSAVRPSECLFCW